MDLPQAQQKRILLVEDDQELNRLLRDFLEHRRYFVIGVYSAVGALNWLRSPANTVPDIVLSDILMGESSGLDLSRSLKKEFPQLPIILFSVVKEMEKAALSAGAIRFLTKPFPLVRLAAVVSEELEKHTDCPTSSFALNPQDA